MNFEHFKACSSQHDIYSTIFIAAAKLSQQHYRCINLDRCSQQLKVASTKTVCVERKKSPACPSVRWLEEMVFREQSKERPTTCRPPRLSLKLMVLPAKHIPFEVRTAAAARMARSLYFIAHRHEKEGLLSINYRHLQRRPTRKCYKFLSP